MKREIKFRGKIKAKDFRVKLAMAGKPKNEGEWTYGEVHLQSTIPHIHEGMDKYPIDVDTIGQFTGLKDKNGKEIYEGDIVKTTQKGGFGLEFIGVVVYCDNTCRFKMEISNKKVFSRGIFFECGMQSMNDGHYTIEWYDEYEVIGNIYDNPELLKGGKE